MRGPTTTKPQIALLMRVHTLLPRGSRVSLVGDCEFGHPMLIEFLKAWGWDYALRQSEDHLA